MINSLSWVNAAALSVAVLTAACGGGGGGGGIAATASVTAATAAAAADTTATATNTTTAGIFSVALAPAEPLAHALAVVGAATAIMPLGDSITYGSDGQGTQGGWRTNLWNWLQNDGVKVDFVGSQNDGPASLGDRDHEGHPGWRIGSIAGSIDGWLGTYQPQLVLLMIGTNDIVFNDDLANAPARLGRLIDQINAKLPNSRLLVASIPPLGDAGLDAKVRAYNAAIPGLVGERVRAGRRVAFVDMNAALRPADLFDGTHPTPDGYAKMSLVWHNAVLPLLRAGSVVLPLNATKSFQVTTVNYTDHVMRHRDGLGITSVVNANSSDLDKRDATFKLVRGLADANCYSFQSVNFPNDYLRHANWRVRKDGFVDNDLFKQDATWCARGGASGKGVSFESVNYPGHYIRHFDDQLWLASGADLYGSGGAGPFIDDISFIVANPLAPNVSSGGSAEARDTAAMTELLAHLDVRANGWTKGPTLDAIINTYDRTGDARYRSVIDQSFDAGKGWRSGDANKLYYDDMAWYANAWLRAYDVTGDAKFLTEAQAIFSDMTRAWDGTCGGGLWWNSDRQYKNAITNELFLLAASRLARRAPNGSGAGSYRDWALKEWAWLSGSGMINANHLVNDGLDANCKNNGQATWSYNQGVVLGGLVEMWRLTGQRGYLADAEQIAQATISTLAYPNGVLRDVCDESPGGCGGDATIFKGMFVQGLARLYNADRGNKPLYGDYLALNADSLWNNSRTPQNGLGVKWVGPAGTPSPSSQAAGALLLGEVALLNAGGERSP